MNIMKRFSMAKRSVRLLSIISAVLLYGTTAAQQKVSGIISDSVTNKPLSFATVRLLNQNRIILKNTISDSTGHFHFHNVVPGLYLLKVSITGYNSRYSAIFELKNTDITLPVFPLSYSNEMLAGVTVTAQRPLIAAKIDGFVYNAGQDVQNAGESAADLLRKIPEVQIDQNGIPQMRGSSRIKVFIDGRPSITYANSVADALRQISADNIQTVEVITHPSARYDAEGVDGVINLFTKKPLSNGISGTANGILGTRFNELTSSMTWKHQQAMITIDLGHSNSSNIMSSQLDRIEHMRGIPKLEQKRVVNSNGKNFFGGAGFIYSPDTLTTLNAGYRYNGDWFGAETILDNVSANDIFFRNIDNPSQRFLHGVNGGWLKKSRDKSTEFNLMGYWFYQGQRGHYLLNQFRNGQTDYSEKNRNVLDNREFSFQADISKKLNRGNELEIGVKGAFRKFSYHNIFDVFDFTRAVYLPDTSRADRFWFNWAIMAAYGSYTLSLGSWKIKAGLRYENTHWPLHFREIVINIPAYQNLLPNIIFNKKISTKHNISLGYSRKLLRPYINYLNPVINYIDSLNLEYGNPNLKPAITNSYDLSYIFQQSSWMLNIALFYNQTGNSIERIRISQDNGIIANTYANIADYDVLGSTINASLRLERFTFSLINTSRYLRFDSKKGFPVRNGFIINQNLDVTFRPNTSWTIRAYVNLNSRNINIQGYTSTVPSYTFSINKEFLGGKLNLSGRCDNPFAPYRYITEVIEGELFDQQIESRYINRLFRVALRWKWGKKEVTRPQVREIGGY